MSSKQNVNCQHTLPQTLTPNSASYYTQLMCTSYFESFPVLSREAATGHSSRRPNKCLRQ